MVVMEVMRVVENGDHDQQAYFKGADQHKPREGRPMNRSKRRDGTCVIVPRR